MLLYCIQYVRLIVIGIEFSSDIIIFCRRDARVASNNTVDPCCFADNIKKARTTVESGSFHSVSASSRRKLARELE
jgi:hypothetical protein